MIKKYMVCFLATTLVTTFNVAKAQSKDTTKTTDLFADLENESKKADANVTDYASATFKSTRVVNGHSIETIGKNNLDFRISHRFGFLNSGSYNMFGLDQKAIMLQMQQALELSKMKLEQTTVVGESGGGLVRIELNGNRKLTSLQINTSIIEMDKDDLEDLLTVALGRALDEANKINENEVASSARKFIPGI